MTNPRLRIGSALAVALLLLAAGWVLKNQLAADRQGTWVRATRADLVTGIDVSGTLASADSGSVGPPQIEDDQFKVAMMAPEGSEVKKGQPVLGFDTSDLERRLEEKTAESEEAAKEIEKRRADLHLHREEETMKLAEAEAQLRKTSMKLEAPRDLNGQKERRQVELDHELAVRETTDNRHRIEALGSAARAEIALLESRQRTAQAEVVEIRNAIEKMTVTAPRDGTIVYVTNWRGDKKKVGDSAWKMEQIIEIPDLNKMIADGDVDEIDAGKVAVGQRVVLHLDARPDEQFHGTIRKASKAIQQQRGTKDPLQVLHVEIALDRSDPAIMRPGMRFEGTVELSRLHDVLTVPKAAVFVTPRGAVARRRTLFGVRDVALTIGHDNEQLVQVLSGLSANDRVLIAGQASVEEAAR